MLFFITNIKAYENEYFSLKIPDGYTLVKTIDNIYKWENETNYFSISISDNSNLNYNISKFNDDDLANQKKYIEDSINKSINDYDVKAKVNNINKIHYKNAYILKYDVYWPSNEIIGHDIYQIGNIFTTKKYIITFIYSSNNKIDDDTEYNKLLDSFNIRDQSNSSYSYKIIFLIFGILLCIFSLIKVILDKKSNLNN